MAVLFRMQKGQKYSINVSVPAFGNKGNDILLFDEDDEIFHQPSSLLMEHQK